MRTLNSFEHQIDQFVAANNLKPADAILVKKLPTKLLNHYIIYLGFKWGRHVFMANTFSGVVILNYSNLMKELRTFQPEKIERFVGNEWQRNNAVKRAFSRKDENSYHLILNNCEHYKNWVQKGSNQSQQVEEFGKVAGISILIFGIAWALGD